MDKFSFLGNSDINSIEKIYEQYKSDPNSVDLQWHKFFEGFEFAQKQFPVKTSDEIFDNEFKVINLIEGYRKRGHLFTKTNPVRSRRKYSPTLAIENYGLTKDDLKKTFQAGKKIGIGPATLEKILEHLEQPIANLLVQNTCLYEIRRLLIGYNKKWNRFKISQHSLRKRKNTFITI